MKKCDTFAFMFLALGAGVAAGILLAPKSGRETRKELSEKLERGFEETGYFLSYEAGRIRNFFTEMLENCKCKTDSRE